MSAADYIITFVSIVFGLALTDVATSLHKLLRAARRVRWDWLAPVAALFIAMTIVSYWWGFYQRMEVSDLAHFGTFLPVLGELMLLFLLASAVLPDDIPEDGLDLRAYYLDNRVYFWGLSVALVTWTTISHIALRLADGAPLGPAVLGSLDNIVILPVFALLMWTRRWWAHGLVLAVLLAVGTLDWHAMRVGEEEPPAAAGSPPTPGPPPANAER